MIDHNGMQFCGVRNEKFDGTPGAIGRWSIHVIFCSATVNASHQDLQSDVERRPRKQKQLLYSGPETEISLSFGAAINLIVEKPDR